MTTLEANQRLAGDLNRLTLQAECEHLRGAASWGGGA